MASDLISRDALLEFAQNHINGTIDCNDIARFPAVDAVEVVRCKDCRFEGGIPMPIGYIYCYRTDSVVGNNDFCSYGEKMDGGEKDAD